MFETVCLGLQCPQWGLDLQEPVWLPKGPESPGAELEVRKDAWMEKSTYSWKSDWVNHDMNSFRRRMYGPNLIDVPVKPYTKLLFEEVKNRSFIYCLWFWCLNVWSHILLNWTCAFLFVSVFICIFRSSTLSMCSSYSASPCGWLIIIIFTPYAYSSSPLGLSSSHYMRFARWAYSWILDLMIMYLFRPQNG